MNSISDICKHQCQCFVTKIQVKVISGKQGSEDVGIWVLQYMF